MTEQKWPQIQCTVKDFGPIREGSFDLAPLTVFIGPNRSGKTYAATLAYLFGQSLWETLRLESFFNITDSAIIADPEGFAILAGWPRRATDFLEHHLPQYFGQEMGLIVRRGSDSLEIGVQIGDIPLQIQGIWQQETAWKWMHRGWDQICLRPFLFPRRRSKLPQILELDWREFSQVLQRVVGFPPTICYLPAARAGLLQGWRVLAAMAIRLVRRELGLRRIEATPYAGVAGDFLLTLAEERSPYWAWWKEPGISKDQTAVTDLLEKEILHGYIDWLSPEEPELMLFQKGMQIPLTAISSGLAELAPLDLLLRKKIIGPGDWLIIEEPEAHLHPENQRRIATLMVRLVRWGVRVLCTTHSDIILHQISNHLLLEEVLKKGRQPESLDPEWDRLGYDEVGVYLFRLEDDSSVIEPVVPEPGFGIPEDEFVRVAEAIGDQTYSLIDLIESD